MNTYEAIFSFDGKFKIVAFGMDYDEAAEEAQRILEQMTADEIKNSLEVDDAGELIDIWMKNDAHIFKKVSD